MKCSVAECNWPSRNNGYCTGHYQRTLVGIEMDTPIRPKRYHPYQGLSAPEVVAAALAEIAPTATGCIEWPYSSEVDGYVRLSVKKKRHLLHRVSWEVANGRAIPAGLMVRHHCDNPPCFNPDHLGIGTARDNVQDAVKRGRRAVGERHPETPFSNDDIRSIRAAFNAGQSISSLARERGVMTSAIHCIVYRKTWKHIA